MVILAVALIAFRSCKTESNSEKVLSHKETRKQMMDTIANNSEMMMEMTDAILNSKHGKMMIQENEKMMRMMTENKDAMGKMMKNNPDIMNNMMSGMMEAAKGDSAKMSGMVQTMMGNQQMMHMMQNMMGGNAGTDKTEGMKKMEGMHNK